MIDKGLSTIFFQEIDKISINKEDDVLNVLTGRIKENIDYPLPPGYIKVKEKYENLSYKIPNGLLPFIGRARVLVIPIIDELIN